MRDRNFDPNSFGVSTVSPAPGGRSARVLSRADLQRCSVPVLADLLIEACHRHGDVTDLVLRQLSKPLDTHDANTGHGGREPVIVGACPAMKDVFHEIRRYAPTNAPILVTGESGTGKELVALAIHERSTFSDGPFVAVNCGGLPPNLIASELFGHEKGAFTGAVARHIGHIERANGGTLFLDEIGDLPLDLQAHFLRCLETGTIERVGGTQAIPVNVRVVAATYIDLEGAVVSNRFRHDLFFRLDVLRVHLPPLRERDGDIEVLVKFFRQRIAEELGVPERTITARAMEALKAYHWPGNVRELISIIRRALVTADAETIDVVDLELNGPAPYHAREGFAPAELRPTPDPAEAKSERLLDVRRQAEADAIRTALKRNRYNVTKAARQLGIARATIYKRMKKLGIEV